MARFGEVPVHGNQGHDHRSETDFDPTGSGEYDDEAEVQQHLAREAHAVTEKVEDERQSWKRNNCGESSVVSAPMGQTGPLHECRSNRHHQSIDRDVRRRHGRLVRDHVNIEVLSQFDQYIDCRAREGVLTPPVAANPKDQLRASFRPHERAQRRRNLTPRHRVKPPTQLFDQFLYSTYAHLVVPSSLRDGSRGEHMHSNQGRARPLGHPSGPTDDDVVTRCS